MADSGEFDCLESYLFLLLVEKKRTTLLKLFSKNECTTKGSQE